MTSEEKTGNSVGCTAPALAGAVAAAALSWRLNASIAWAVLHFFCSWPYVVWALLVRTEELAAILKKMGVLAGT